MTNKVVLTLRLIRLREAIERWIAEEAFKDSAYEAEAHRLLEDSTAEEVSY